MWVYWVIGGLLVVILVLVLIIRSKNDDIETQRTKFQNTIDCNEAEFQKGIIQFHNALTERYGDRYLYEISGAEIGDYLDKDFLPHSYSYQHAVELDRYTLYPGDTKFHRYNCRHSLKAFPENAYSIKNKYRRFFPCAVCNSQLPNMDWVEKYKRYNQFLQKYAGVTHKGGAPTQYKEEPRQEIIRQEEAYKKEQLEEALQAIPLKREKLQLTEELRMLSLKRDKLKQKEDFIERTMSSLTAIPYMAAIIADFETHGLELLAQQLDWGSSQERAKKVISIRQIRKETSEAIAKSKEAQYQLEYAIRMFPGLEDFLETDYRELHVMDLSEIGDKGHDRARNYLSGEEYNSLSSAERNQLALDRYRTSHRKSNWQIGRDYEYYIGYLYTKKGYTVEYFGSENGLEDLGRDLIAKKDSRILIVQCKYWSAKKKIREKHINQLYGTMIAYSFENNLPADQVCGVLVTNITLSDTAKRFAKYLGIQVRENLPLGEYPCIKCNINRDEHGFETKIYHLPFDQQYDVCKIDQPGEFFALTVAEAEAAGYRRAFRWHDK